ncbi:DUF4082 domain-containing protein [Microlunatus aurantiacus]|uniref:DUF4082 domain-containing protein n=1 Tax=Microlunatus aurantiacus TaxID=446786 RepID=UPI0031E2E8CA
MTGGLVRAGGEPVIVRSDSPIEAGIEFSSSVAGKVTALRVYVAGSRGTHRAALWNSGGRLLAKSYFTPEASPGWLDVQLASPVLLTAGQRYVVSLYSSAGQYAVGADEFTADRANGPLTAHRALYRNGKAFPRTQSDKHYLVDVAFSYDETESPEPTTPPTSTPLPTATPSAPPTSPPRPTASPTITSGPTTTPAPPSGGWPNAANTGVPAGTTLSPYTGPCTIATANVVIDARTVNCTLQIQAPGVRITRSLINGGVDVRSAASGSSFTITDSEVRIGDNLNTGLMRANFHANRVEITGGRRSVYCETNCVIENSWVHGQGGDPAGQAHFSGIRMSQNTTIRHNTITCDGRRLPPASGCSAGLTGYGDFAPVQNNLIENNIFYGGTSTVCAYGGSSQSKPYSSRASNIRFINNVFVRGASGRCGNLGAIFSFDSTAPGNSWVGNTWDDGTQLRP